MGFAGAWNRSGSVAQDAAEPVQRQTAPVSPRPHRCVTAVRACLGHDAWLPRGNSSGNNSRPRDDRPLWTVHLRVLPTAPRGDAAMFGFWVATNPDGDLRRADEAPLQTHSSPARGKCSDRAAPACPDRPGRLTASRSNTDVHRGTTEYHRASLRPVMPRLVQAHAGNGILCETLRPSVKSVLNAHAATEPGRPAFAPATPPDQDGRRSHPRHRRIGTAGIRTPDIPGRRPRRRLRLTNAIPIGATYPQTNKYCYSY